MMLQFDPAIFDCNFINLACCAKTPASSSISLLLRTRPTPKANPSKKWICVCKIWKSYHSTSEIWPFASAVFYWMIRRALQNTISSDQAIPFPKSWTCAAGVVLLQAGVFAASPDLLIAVPVYSREYLSICRQKQRRMAA